MVSLGDLLMSLASAQEKLGLRIAANGDLFLPEGTAASTHLNARRHLRIFRTAMDAIDLHQGGIPANRHPYLQDFSLCEKCH
jgi:hypothetical protein